MSAILTVMLVLAILGCVCCCGAIAVGVVAGKNIYKENERLNRFADINEVPPIISDDESSVNVAAD